MISFVLLFKQFIRNEINSLKSSIKLLKQRSRTILT